MAARRTRGGITVEFENFDRLRRQLRRINPAENLEIIRDSLLESAFLLQRDAAEKQIIRGGGGPPRPSRLTSRTGTGRRSISVFRRGLGSRRPFIEVGPKGAAERYMSLHELGGTVRRRAHSRRTQGGGTARVRSHSARYPKRAYLAPALAENQVRIRDIFIRRWTVALRRASRGVPGR